MQDPETERPQPDTPPAGDGKDKLPEPKVEYPTPNGSYVDRQIRPGRRRVGGLVTK